MQRRGNGQPASILPARTPGRRRGWLRPGVLAAALLAGVVHLAGACGGHEGEGRAPAERVLRVAVPPDGLLAPPVFRMEETQPLAAEGLVIEVAAWRGPQQLRALVASGSVDFAGLHVPTAALFAERDLDVRFLGASLGNVLHVVTDDPEAAVLEDLRGRTVAVPMRGEFPDIMFRAALEESGLTGSVEIRYVATALDAANLVASGSARAAVVAEPHVSILLEKQERHGAADRRLYASVDIQAAWARARGEDAPMPTAGLAAIGPVARQDDVLRQFWSAYAGAVAWCLANPGEAATLHGAAERDEAALRGAARAFSACARVPVPSLHERARMEDFLDVMGAQAPDTFGGLRPGDDFYWDPVEAGGTDARP